MFNRFGSISHGTLRNEDLFNAFLDEAKERFQGNSIVEDIGDVLYGFSQVDSDEAFEALYESEWCSEAIQELQDLLNSDLPPFVYFGTLEGDGSDFGYWFDSELFNEQRNTGECQDLSEPFDETTEVNTDAFCLAYVNDHGNITLYDINGNELYSIV